MNRLLILTLAAFAALAAPAAADTSITDYAVTIEGTADYNRADIDGGDTSVQHDIGLKFKTEIPRLRFDGRVAQDSTGALGTASVTRGSYVITGDNGIQVRCTSHSLGDTTGGGLDASFTEHATTFATRVIDMARVDVGGCDAVLGDWSFPMGSGGQEVGIGIFDGAFTVPHSRIGEPSMTFPLSGKVTGNECPFFHFNTVLCSLTWDAVVTFTRNDDDLIVPIVPDPTTPEPPKPPVDPDEDLLVPIVPPNDDDLLVPISAKPRMTRNLTSASLPFRCEETCKGTLTAKAGGRTLATKAVKAAAGKVATAVVRFDRADRRAIRRAKAVKLTLEVRDGARKARRTATVRAR